MLVVLVVCALAVAVTADSGGSVEGEKALRPPAVPLVTHDPYFSVWSMTDRLTEGWSKHWTGANHALCGIARIDGKPYRFMGIRPEDVPPMNQTRLQVTPTRTMYTFEADGVELQMTFLTPALPNDLDVLSRPVTYVLWQVHSTDGKTHDVSLYLDASAEWAVNTTDQQVVWSRYKLGEMDVLRVGTTQQPVLEKSGDNLRIDWGYLYLAVPAQAGDQTVMTAEHLSRPSFAQRGQLPDSDDLRMPRAAHDDWVVLACALHFGPVGQQPVSRHILIAYDDLYSIEYFHRRLRPYWRRAGMEVDDLLRLAERDLPQLQEECARFDAELTADLKRVGGEKYADLCVLAYRQCLAAHKLVADFDGTPLFFSKENFSNGCIATVDVTYPSSPFFLLFNTELLKAMLTPVLDYARSPRWKFPFAPHDLGTYPKANGQVYGGGERSEENQMPVEECGNMLLMVAALAKAEGNADYAKKYWNLLTQWAEYLREKGLDPENQLCTDDFAGHLAHNTNLSLKAILALGGYSMLCRMMGDTARAEEYHRTARQMAQQWMRMADDGDHYRLAFDKPGTWSQKYNLVWDELLALHLFPKEVARKEMAYYKTKMNRYGLPLDNRHQYTKLDWTVWTATLAESREDFNLLIDAVWRWMNETPSRVPLTDWYWTHDGKQVGFQARSVVGGVFIKMLAEPTIWQKWLARSRR
ncbi:MAG: glutaminase domain-containing protein [Armatimonadota bacterium]